MASEVFLKNALEMDAATLQRLLGDYSYVLQSDKTFILQSESKIISELELGHGNWILTAKGTIRAGGGRNAVQLTLSATDGVKIYSDISKASVNGSIDTGSADDYATISVLTGAHLAKDGKVTLAASQIGIPGSAELSHVVLAAVRNDKLLLWAL